MGYSFQLTARVLLNAPSHREDSTYHGLCYTSHRALAGTRGIDPMTHHTGLLLTSILRSGCSSVVEHQLMMCWIIGLTYLKAAFFNYCSTTGKARVAVCTDLYLGSTAANQKDWQWVFSLAI